MVVSGRTAKPCDALLGILRMKRDITQRNRFNVAENSFRRMRNYCNKTSMNLMTTENLIYVIVVLTLCVHQLVTARATKSGF